MTNYKKNIDLVPGSWYPYKVPSGYSVLFCCPHGHLGNLGDHFIDDKGVVTPSVVCVDDTCEFHEYIVLEGWDAK